MTNSDQVNQEYLLIKCFLYKYTPPFDQVTLPPSVSNDFSLSTFTPYSLPLDDTNYFTKYDISQFVTEYSFEQNIEETTYSWSVTLQDLALSYSTLNSTLKVPPPPGSTLRGGLSFEKNTESKSTGLLAEFESNANTFDNNDYTSNESNNPIRNAKYRRGLVGGPLTSQVNTSPNTQGKATGIPGLRLSDLIQEYDFISVYLYKSTTPLTDIYGTVTLKTNAGATNTTTGSVSTGFSAASSTAPTSLSALQNNPLYIFDIAFTDSDQVSFTNAFNKSKYQTLTDSNLKYESILLTKLPNGKTLFSNDFNGFVMRKSVTSTIDQVDRISVSGNGWSRLFGATRRAVKTSLFANALYQAGQVTGLTDVTPYENIFAGQPIGNILRDLFDTVYKIDFNALTSTELAAATTPINPVNSTNLKTCPLVQDDFFANPQGLSTTGNDFSTSGSTALLGTSFFNITSLIVANGYPANIFCVPPYLLSSVMKLRPFAYIEPIDFPVSSDYIKNAQTAAAQLQIGSGPLAATPEVTPATFQQAMQALGNQVINYGSTSPVFVDPTIQNLKAYFRFLDQVFLSFAPQIQTPYEILDQIRSIAFIEIYEQPSGQFVVRAPQYNNMADSVPGRPDIAMIHSSNLNIITSTYSESAENLVSKILTGYSPEMLAIGLLQQFGYCDGKLLSQIGQLEMETVANPNATTASTSNTATNNSKTTGIFGWAEYLMELSNAKRKFGTVTCDLDSSIQVGNTFVDETKFKFGYIVAVNKHVAVTGTASMSFTLSYVRDGVPVYAHANNSLNYASITNINTDLLPVLTDIENSFAAGS